MDALQKHSQTTHDARLPPTRKPPTKKRKIEAVDDAGSNVGEGAGEGDEVKVEIMTTETMDDSFDDESMIRVLSQHPGESPHFVRYVVTAAKYKYSIAEHASLVDELDLLRTQEERLRTDKDALVDRVVERELGPKAAAHFVAPLPCVHERSLSFRPSLIAHSADGGLLSWTFERRTTLPHGRRAEVAVKGGPED
jgi:hypothetical protein